jgi:hypothetical protein
MTDQELYDYVFNGICDYKDKHYADMSEYFSKSKDATEDEKKELWKKVHPYHFPYEAYVELAKDVVRVIYDSHCKDTGKRKVFVKGTKMRVVLASNMGDLCLTRDLKALRGYELRIEPGHGEMINCVVMGKP